jgi:hypothetical protein
LLVKEGHFRGPGLQVERCRRVGAGCRDRQSGNHMNKKAGNHVNKKAHRQTRTPAEDGAPCGRRRDDGNPERRLNAARRSSRQATAEDNGKAWRFGMTISVS